MYCHLGYICTYLSSRASHVERMKYIIGFGGICWVGSTLLISRRRACTYAHAHMHRTLVIWYVHVKRIKILTGPELWLLLYFDGASNVLASDIAGSLAYHES